MTKKQMILLIGCISFLSCNMQPDVNSGLKKLIGREMKLPPDIVGFNLADSVSMDTYLNSPYKIIYYIDSMGCTECHIESLYRWKKFFQETDQKKSPIVILFETNDIFDIQMFMEKFELHFPFFLDANKKFKAMNRNILPDHALLSTFLTRNDTIILAGNPIDNFKLRELFITISHETHEKQKKPLNL